MRYASIRSMDITNGEGVRVSIFFQGCKFKCKGCWNESTWNFNDGKEFTKELEDKVIELVRKDHIKGISILGGEPFNQPPEEMLLFLKTLKAKTNKSIYLWTGYELGSIPNRYVECLDHIDMIVTGRFVEELRDLNLLYRGSSNQTIYKKVNGQFRLFSDRG